MFLFYHTGRGEASTFRDSVMGVSRWATPFGGRETRAQAHQLLVQSHSWNNCRWQKKILVSWFLNWYFSHCFPWGMWSGLLWRLLSPHYVKPAVKKHSRFPPAACCNLSGEHSAPGTAVLGAGNPLPTRPPPWPLSSPPCLRSSCTPLPARLPLASSPTLPTAALLGVTLQSLPRPQEGLLLPPGPSPASLALVFPKQISKISCLQCAALCTPGALPTCRYLFDTEMPSDLDSQMNF